MGNTECQTGKSRQSWEIQNVRQERDRQSRERKNVRREGQSRRKERIGLDRLSGRKR